MSSDDEGTTLWYCCSGPDLEFTEEKCPDHDTALKLFQDTADSICNKSVPDIKPGGDFNLWNSQMPLHEYFEVIQSLDFRKRDSSAHRSLWLLPLPLLLHSSMRDFDFTVGDHAP